MKLAKKLLFVTALISAFLTLSALASDDAPLIISPAPVENAQETAAEIKYPDIPEDASYADSVYKLSKAGVLQGYEDGSFRPEGEVTRAEMAKMIILTFGLVGDQKKPEEFYPDIAETEWFYPYVLAIHNLGLVKGYENGEYRPKNNITRAEVCTILYRMFEDDGDKKKVLETSPFIPGMPDRKISDLADNYWGKKYVQIVVNNYLMPLEEGATFRPAENIKRYELADLLAKFVIEAPEILTADVRFFVGDEQWGETEVVAIGTAADVPTAPHEKAPDGYGFKGWKVKGTEGTNVIDVAFNTITEQGTLDYEAVFVKKWKVIFMNGDEEYAAETVLDGEYVEKPEDPTWPGGSATMKFKGWSEADGGVEVDADIVNLTRLKIKKNLVLYARCKETGTINPDFPGPDTPSNPNSDEFMSTLDKGVSQLSSVSGATTKPRIQYICGIVIDFVNDVKDDALEGNYIDKAYINKHYGSLVNAVKLYILESEVVAPLEDPLGKDKGFVGTDLVDFKNLLGKYVTEDVQLFIEDYFDIKMSDYE